MNEKLNRQIIEVITKFGECTANQIHNSVQQPRQAIMASLEKLEEIGSINSEFDAGLNCMVFSLPGAAPRVAATPKPNLKPNPEPIRKTVLDVPPKKVETKPLAQKPKVAVSMEQAILNAIKTHFHDHQFTVSELANMVPEVEETQYIYSTLAKLNKEQSIERVGRGTYIMQSEAKEAAIKPTTTPDAVVLTTQEAAKPEPVVEAITKPEPEESTQTPVENHAPSFALALSDDAQIFTGADGIIVINDNQPIQLSRKLTGRLIAALKASHGLTKVAKQVHS